MLKMLFPTRGVQALSLLVLLVGLILPWWIITERTRLAVEAFAAEKSIGLLRPEMVLLPVDRSMKTPVALSMTAVTAAQYRRVTGKAIAPDNPDEFELISYCRKLSELEGLGICDEAEKAACNGYRLPTAEEWQAAQNLPFFSESDKRELFIARSITE